MSSLASSPDQLLPASDINIRDYLNIIRRRKAVFTQVFVLVLAIGIVVTALAKPIYETRAQLVISSPPPSILMQEAKDPFAGILDRINPDNLPTQIRVLQSPRFITEAKKRAGITPNPSVAAPQVTVEAADPTSNVIVISVSGGDPEQIVALANAMIEQHREETSGVQQQGLEQASKYVGDELERSRRRLVSAEQALMHFRKVHRVVQMSTEQEARAKEYVDLSARVREAQSNVESTRAEVEALRGRLDNVPLTEPVETTRENKLYERLQDRVGELRLRRLELLEQYRPNHDKITSIDQQIREVQTQLDKESPELTRRTHVPNPERGPLKLKLAEMDAALIGYQAKYNAARAAFDARQGTIDDLGPLEIEQKRHERELEAAQAEYAMLSARKSDLDIRNNTPPAWMARVIETPEVPRAPVRPNRTTSIALSAILALCLAAGMALLQEFLDDRVNSPEDVERISALPTLGHVPLISGSQPRLVNALPANSHVAESYRALRSSIGFAGIDAPLRTLQVTSASKGEGKTVTSVNLATAMAIDGKKVILVDADLRRPSVHRLLNLPSSPGLSEVLVGMKTVDEAIQASDVENLSVMCAGPVPPNPAELLGSRAFDQLLEQLETRADVVIFDSPPCVPVTDPLIISSRMDGVVLVLHVGHTKKAAIKHVEGLLARARARIVGVVFNRVEPNRGGYYYHHYYYYYGDGYYADAARSGESHRRNGKTRQVGLASGGSVTSVATVDQDDEA